jgi:hypothetical protein
MVLWEDRVTPANDTLITLKDACDIFFGGRVTVATLKAEHAKGNLEMSKIGRSYWTTIAKLREMEAKCRVAVPARASGSTRSERPGQSLMADPDIARGAALRKLDELKQHFGNTSRGSTGRPPVKRRSLQT